ncbi:MAG: hypothetical protein Q8L21_03565, partial [Candidatus Komeilibacteria bacterium]|nr:hypothetical protein [Candidatus Komeilibacteria bacterium]
KEKKSKALNEAREALSNLEAIKAWREQILNAGGKQQWQRQLDVITESWSRQVRFNLSLYTALWRFSAARHYVDLLGVSREPVLLFHSSTAKDMDFAMASYGDDIADSEERKIVRREARQKQIDSHHTTLSISQGRLIETDFKGKEKDLSRRLLVGVVTEEAVRKGCNGSNEPFHNFLAKVCRVKIDPASTKMPKLPFSYGICVSRQELTTQISWPNFVRLLPHLTMSLAAGGQIFSLEIMTDGRANFRLEGKISCRKPALAAIAT